MREILAVVILFTFTVILADVNLNAETIRLKDGQELDGEVVRRTEESVVVRIRSGDSFTDIVYMKADIEEAESAPRQTTADGGAEGDEVASGIQPTARYSVKTSYRSDIGALSGSMLSLKSQWSVSRANLPSIIEKISAVNKSVESFKTKYAKSSMASYEIAEVGFQHFGYFTSSVNDVERSRRRLDDYSNKNRGGDSLSSSLAEVLREHERMASDYMDMACKRIDRS